MENNFFKSVIDADDAPVVICDLEQYDSIYEPDSGQKI